MKKLNYFLCGVGIAAVGISSALAATPNTPQEQAVAAFPDLAKVGSPLHTKFMELYGQAKATNSPILSKADWPLILAQQASKMLIEGSKSNADSKSPGLGIELQFTKLYVPSPNTPDFDPTKTFKQAEEDWQKTHSHTVTLPAHIFTPEDNRRVLDDDNAKVIGLEKALKRYKEVTFKRETDGFKALLEPKARKGLDDELSTVAKKVEFAALLPFMCPAKLLLVVQADKYYVVFVWTAVKKVIPVLFVAVGDEYLMAAEQVPGSEQSRWLLNDISMFLQHAQPSDLVSK